MGQSGPSDATPPPWAAQRGGEFYQDFRAAQAGDDGALERLARAAREELLWSIRARLRGGWTGAWVEDVVQQALVGVVLHLRDCRAASEGELLAWIRAIGRREVANLFRLHEAEGAMLGFGAREPSVRVDEGAPNSSLVRLLRRRLQGVGDEGHELLWLRLVIHASWAEVAVELGTTPSGAKRRYQRLVDRLRRAEGRPLSGAAGGHRDRPDGVTPA